MSRTLQRIFGRPPEHPPDEAADMLKDKSFRYLWEAKFIPNSYVHHFKTSFKHTSLSQFATEAQIAKIKGFRKKLLCFPEQPQNQPEGPPKQEDEGECFAPYTPKTPKTLLEHSKAS